MGEYRLKSNNGNGANYLIRRAIENKKHFVIEICFGDRKYPNVISGRYLRLKDARQAISDYQHNSNSTFWGNVY